MKGKPNAPDDVWKRGVRTSTGCLIWQGPCAGEGLYGVMKLHGKNVYVHRLAYELANGPFPLELDVLHHCDVTRCFEPAHLFTGTQLDNMRDMLAKGRSGSCPGASNPRARLTEDQVRTIRVRYAAGDTTLARLGVEYGVSFQNISDIVNRKRWKSVQ